MDRTLCSLILALAASLACASGPGAPTPFQWRGVWEWSMAKKTDADLTRIADAAHGLGFNALLMSPPADRTEFMRDLCHERGIELYLSTVFARVQPGWEQVLAPGELEGVKAPRSDSFQQGGEPLEPGEIFTQVLACWNKPQVREYFRGMVAELAARPADGLAFDYVGYTNYRRCYCPVCEGKLKEFRTAHRGLSEHEASAICAEQAMVDFVNEMAAAARQVRPDIKLTIHVYPYFAPNPYHGQRFGLDYAGQTVAWFFRPHWPIAKVARLAETVVREQHECYPDSLAAPFIGFYHRPIRNVRSAARVRREIEAIAAAGAQAIQFAELGNIARDGTVARAVAEQLGGQGLSGREW